MKRPIRGRARPECMGSPRYKIGDLWEYRNRGYWVVVPTNIGWRPDRTAIMGAGVARQAALRHPSILPWYGRLCRKYRDMLGIVLENRYRLILFPTKFLNPSNPALSWKKKSTLAFIEDSLDDLIKVVNDDRGVKPIAIPWVGCGNGGLERKEVKPLLDRYLDSRFVVVRSLE